jgi:hypothetical protein
MTKQTSILIGAIAVLVAGVALVVLGILAERSEAWQLGALLVLGGAGMLGLKRSNSTKSKLLVIAVACILAAGCSIRWNGDGIFAGVFADSIRIRLPGVEVDAKDAPPRYATTRRAQ